MIRTILYTSIIFFSIGCMDKIGASSNVKSDPIARYKLRTRPEVDSKYHYDIANETTMNLEVDGKEIENHSRSNFENTYNISIDGAGKLLLTLKFDKISIYSKIGDKVKEMSSDNSYSSDPSERLLSILKETNFQSSLDSNGNTKLISRVKEISDKIMAAFPGTDQVTRNSLESQWNKIIGEQFVNQKTSQLFQTFPDTQVYVGSTWTKSTTEQGELPITIDNLFTLKSINAETAVIKVVGTVTNTSGEVKISGIGSNIKSNLKGDQQGEYEIETKTGMVIKSQVKANFRGTIQAAGREIPIRIKSSVKINGKRI